MRRRLKLKLGDKDITKQAAVIYRAAFNGEALPKDWRVVFLKTRGRRWGYSVGPYGHRGAVGRCCWGVSVILLHRSCWHGGGSHSGRAVPGSSWLGVLIHEFIHLRCPFLQHGREFDRLTAAAYARVWAS